MILTEQDIKEKLPLCDGYTLLKYKKDKEFEIKIVDDFGIDYLIIDNDFISKKPLKLKEYISLCKNIIEKLMNGSNLNTLSVQ